jgi:hypothetical protein
MSCALQMVIPLNISVPSLHPAPPPCPSAQVKTEVKPVVSTQASPSGGAPEPDEVRPTGPTPHHHPHASRLPKTLHPQPHPS